MVYNRTAFTLSLFASMIFTGSHLPAVSSSTRAMPAAGGTQKAKEAQKSEEHTRAADAAREAGRRALRHGDAGEALGYLDDALKLYSQDGNKSSEAATHDLLGELYERQGRYGLALEHFESAHKTYTELHTKAGEYNANLMLAKTGNMHYRQGDLGAARRSYQLMNVEKPDTGALGKAKRVAEVVGAGIGSGRGSSKVKVPSGAAGALFTKKLFDFYRQTIMYAGRETGMGRLDYRSRDFESARKHFENALSATKGDLPGLGNLGQTRRFRVGALTSLGDVALAQGRFKKAVELYDDAGNDATKEKRLDLMWPAQRGHGRSLWLQAGQENSAKKKEKLQADALKAYADALEKIERLRAGSLRADEARATFLATTIDVFDEASSALAEMALMSARAETGKPLEGQALKYAAKAFEVVERGRARSLLDLLTETGTNIREGVPPDLRKRKQENLDKQAEIAQSILGVILTDQHSKSVEALDEEADRLQNEEVSIENEIRAKSPRYRSLTSTQPLTLAQVQQQVLDEGTALLEYSLGSEASYLWALTKGGVRLFKLPGRGELNTQTDEMRRQILPPDSGRTILELTLEDKQRGLTMLKSEARTSESDFVSASHRLFKSILEPAMGFVGARRLLIIPDGALSFVPFEALVTAPRGADYASLPYLVKSNETVYGPSASVVGAMRREVSATVGSGAAILLIADPVFNIGDERAKTRDVGPPAAAVARGLSVKSAVADVAGMEITANFQIRRLKGTRNEADQIEKTAGAAGLRTEKWLDLDASEANAHERDLKPYRIIHIATHGFLDPKHPQFTGIVLSLVGNKEGNDGFLRTDEIFNLRLGSPLVMLSACETGLGKEKRGEGVIGLTRAFMYAGAPLVGVSLWSVDDDSTAYLMADFYKNLLSKDGAKPATALRVARQNMIDGHNKYSAPYYWAPFVLVGDWTR